MIGDKCLLFKLYLETGTSNIVKKKKSLFHLMNHVGRCSGFWMAGTYIIKTSLKLQGSKIIPTLKKATDGLCFLTANPGSSPRLFSESLTQEMRSINAKK